MAAVFWPEHTTALPLSRKGKWSTYTTKDGLAHNGMASIDISDLIGDVWLGTLAGLTRWSSGKLATFNQFNSGLPNDLVYCVICDGKDVWVATGGGAGRLDTFTNEWEIFTEKVHPCTSHGHTEYQPVVARSILPPGAAV